MSERTNIIEANESIIREEIGQAWEEVIRCGGRICKQIYIWSDGQIQRHETVSGSNSWLQANDCESRKLYFVCEVKQPFFAITDYIDDVEAYSADPDAYIEGLYDWYVNEFMSEEIDKYFIRALEY